ncbi:uncharacterized protein LOC107041422 [Diachasma alloeum]|uniref:uncharacterized protein LOC107041422 n=1 Tax=Diachasma alloeum TaxID=454923 RepID=UPI0007384D39|nr:uncharacterized protein LOC107041422 [Diachasma alloeum]
MLSPDGILHTLKISWILVIASSIASGNDLFENGKKYTYSYFTEVSSGVLLPSRAASTWGLKGIFDVETTDTAAFLQLHSTETFIRNGPDNHEEDNAAIKENIVDLQKPFQLIYKDGLITNFSVGTEAAWATNIKRSIAGILQLDLVTLDKEVAFHSLESNHYGKCNIEYVVTPDNNKMVIRKFFDPRTCQGHPHRTWTNVPRLECPNRDENPVMKSSERLYKVESHGNHTKITLINATGEIYIQPFQSLGEAQFLSTRQILQLTRITDSQPSEKSDKFTELSLQHELPESDLSQGRGDPSKDKIFRGISGLLDRLSQRLENPGLDTDIDHLHNKTISILLYYLGQLNRSDLQAAYRNISGTSYKEETIRNMFLETLPQIGTKESALFILELIQQNKVSHITAMQLLTQLPFHIRKPDVQLLVGLQPLLNLGYKTSIEVRNTGILTFGTLIYRTCMVYCPYEMLDDYVRLYLDKFTESKVYEKKMIWLEGLSNIQLGRVVEFLEPIASGNSVESRHLRVLAAWASLPTAPLRPDVIYPVYWPILVNRSEHLEMRIAALTLLIVSNPSANRIISLYWYIQGEPNVHLYNYFYTSLKSMERTTFPCYRHIRAIAGHFTRILRRPEKSSPVVTGNYLFDYQDTKRNFGAVVQSIVIASPSSNIPEVAYFTLNSHGSGTTFNDFSLYMKATGVMQSLSSYLESPIRVKDILKEFKLNKITREPIHLEMIVRVQQKAVLCLHFNETNIANAVAYLSALPDNTYHIYKNMEFHVNQQRINVPLTIESIQATDLGTTTRMAATATSLFSMRGNFTHFPGGRSNHVIFRTAIHGTQVVENYNPILDVWHTAERALAVHGYLPANVTVGLKEKFFLSYNTPAEYLRTGVTIHTRTATTITGMRAKAKISRICPRCSLQYTVRKGGDVLQDKVILETIVPELGGRLQLKVFDCQKQVSSSDLMSDILAHHHSNHHSWTAARFPLMGIHLLDYLSYVPPSGSCGLSVYIEPFNIQPSEVRLEAMKTGNRYMLSLVRSELESMKVLQEWTLAALYESTSWLSDSLKIKASKTVDDGRVLKFCVEIDRLIPWSWDLLSTKHSDPASVKLDMVWGYADSAKGKCSGSSLSMNLAAEVSGDQIEESKEDVWPYKQCRQQSYGKSIVPYTPACYEASRELSTLRKYQVLVSFENLPEEMMSLIWRMRALYDLIGGNSSFAKSDNEFMIVATFPRDPTDATMSVNKSEVSIQYDQEVVESILARTRLHRYIDNVVRRALFSFCTITRESICSAHNATRSTESEKEYLALGHCNDQNPGFALTARIDEAGLTLMIYDAVDNVKIVPAGSGGAIFNYEKKVMISRNFEWNALNSKRFRMDKQSVHVFISNILTFVHYTQDQILLFFPNYIQEFTCGVCTASSFDDSGLYEKL